MNRRDMQAAMVQVEAQRQRAEQLATAREGSIAPVDTSAWVPLRYDRGKPAPAVDPDEGGDIHAVPGTPTHSLFRAATVERDGRYRVGDTHCVVPHGQRERQYHFNRGVATLVHPDDVDDVLADLRHEFERG